jgi:uncharacterized protein YukE
MKCISGDNASLIQKTRRRGFITLMLGGGVGATLAAESQAMSLLQERAVSMSALESEDSWELSAADPLFLYPRLLLDLQFEALRGAKEAPQDAWNKFSEKYSELYRLAKQLERAMPRRNAKLTQIRELAFVGKENARILGGAFSSRSAVAQAHIATLSIITRQVVGSAKEAYQDSQITLSPEASNVLRKLLELIEELKVLQVRMDEAFNSLDVEYINTYDRISLIENALYEAGRLIAEAEYPDTSLGRRAVLKKDAIDTIDRAKSDLQAFEALKDSKGNPVRLTSKGRKVKGLLMDLLTAIQQLIDPSRRVRSIGKLNQTVNLVYVSSGLQGGKANPNEVRSGVRSILHKHLPPVYFLQVATCVALIWPILVTYNEIAKRKELIIGILVYFFKNSIQEKIDLAADDLAKLQVY